MNKHLLLLFFILVTSISYSQSFERGNFTGWSIGQPELYDMDNDDKVDVIAYRKPFFGSVGELFFYKNTSEIDSISFERVSLGVTGIGAPRVADLDSDGDRDIIVAQWNGSQAVLIALYNDGTLNFTIDTLAEDNVYRHRVADLDGDGDMDIVSANRDASTMNIYHNDGNGDFNLETSFTDTDLYQVEVTDFDNDGDVDLILGYKDFFDTKFVKWNNDGNGNFNQETITESAVSNFSIFRVIDFDKNGTQDIVYSTSNGSTIHAVLQTTISTYELMSVFSAPYAVAGFDIANFDADGQRDIIVGGEFQNGISLSINTGPSAFDFSEAMEVATIAPAGIMEHADLDNDGDLDLVVSNGDFWWLENVLPQGTVNTNDIKFENIKVYPNPFQNFVTVAELADGDYYEIYDLSGKCLIRNYTQETALDLSHLDTGAYYLTVKSKNGHIKASELIVKR